MSSATMIWLASVIFSKAALISPEVKGRSEECCSAKLSRKRVMGRDWARDSRNSWVSDFLKTFSRSSLMLAGSSSSMGTDSDWDGAIDESWVAPPLRVRLLAPDPLAPGWLLASKSYGSSGVVRVLFLWEPLAVDTVSSPAAVSSCWLFSSCIDF